MKKIDKIKYGLKKNSPEILIAAGVVGTVGSVVLACRATLKANNILESHKKVVETIHSVSEEEDVTEDDIKKSLAMVYTQTGLGLVRLYSPAVILGAVSLTSIIASHNILRKRNVSLAAAYAVLDKGYKDYRGRVIEKFGEAVDKELKYNLKEVEVEAIETDENGKEKKVKKKVMQAEASDYAVYFDKNSPYFETDDSYNQVFFKAAKQYLNSLLQANGIVFLNDVYKELGLPSTQEGQVVGWLYNPEDPNRDNCIDIDILDYVMPDNEYHIGKSNGYLLDFNVDGNVWKYMKKQMK